MGLGAGIIDVYQPVHNEASEAESEPPSPIYLASAALQALEALTL